MSLSTSSYALASERSPDGGGGTAGPTDESAESRERIAARLAASRADLMARGLLSGPRSVGPPVFEWPLRAAATLDDPGYHAIDAFVDHNASFPGGLLDYECGSRTYDTGGGYNHRGSDFFLWPFSWLKVDQSAVEVVAAAGGVIVDRVDGNFDRRCGCATDDPNLVIVEHPDGSVAWYLHLKNGSVTAKPVGSSVAAGESLGIVASSGCSSGPHLHFEVHDAGDAVVDPYDGPCNATTAASLWRQQRPYYDSAVNALATHSAPPEFPPCPQTEIPNFSDDFKLGDTMIVAVYYRDQLPGDQTGVTLYRPNGSVFDSWTHTYPGPYFAASYWYWFVDLPTGAPVGVWRFSATYRGEVHEHEFRVGLQIFVDGFESGNTSAWSSTIP
ncbi:MAG TPA: peptidoglycan DD-metalloendopeptidase family protein [Thermoanaerobaculia bacterium]